MVYWLVIKFIHLVFRRAHGMELAFMKGSFELLYIGRGHLKVFSIFITKTTILY